MKMRGKKVQGRNRDVIAIPLKTDGGGVFDLVFEAESIESYDDFEKLVKEPKPPNRNYPDGRKEPDFQNEAFKKLMSEYNTKRSNWMFLKSTSITKDLEWETVDMSKPETWGNYVSELKEAGMNKLQIRLVENMVYKVNSYDEDMIDAARQRFLAGQPLDGSSPSQQAEPTNTNSGEPMSDSDSPHPDGNPTTEVLPG
jgi:hypothetical protein